MANLSSLLSSTALGQPSRIIVTDARTWVASRDCTVVFTAFGASGSGALAKGSSTANATGGGAGAKAVKTVKVKAGDTFILTPGAGGAGLNHSTTAAISINGNDGGDTTITGPYSTNIVGGGGKGGVTGTNAASVPGGAGGVATGGDENVTGGRGGGISPTATNCASGGGALPIKGTFNGGGISGSARCASGGAGIGGNGGTVASTASQMATGGGGSFTNGDNATVANTGSAGGVALQLGSTVDQNELLVLWANLIAGNGSNGVASASGTVAGLPAGNGGGTGGLATGTGGNATTAAANGGLFGGTGGAVGANASSADGQFAASGAAVSTSTSSTVITGKGGDGFILMEIY